MKKEIVGYVGKSYWAAFLKAPKFDRESEFDNSPYLSKRKGTKSDWAKDSWPPVKVRMTVEEV